MYNRADNSDITYGGASPTLKSGTMWGGVSLSLLNCGIMLRKSSLNHTKFVFTDRKKEKAKYCIILVTKRVVKILLTYLLLLHGAESFLRS